MKMPISPNDSDRLELALMKKLDIPPNNVSSGSIVVEWDNETAVVTWQGFAAMPADEFLKLWNETRMRSGS